MQASVDVVHADFEEVILSGDVVYFEFCLQETVDPQKALAHTRALAPNIVVFDHLPGSDWAYYAGEEERVCRSAEAVKRFGIRRRETFCTAQRFQDHVELLAKVAPQGTVVNQAGATFRRSDEHRHPHELRTSVVVTMEIAARTSVYDMSNVRLSQKRRPPGEIF